MSANRSANRSNIASSTPRTGRNLKQQSIKQTFERSLQQQQQQQSETTSTVENSLDDVNISDDEEGGTRIGGIYIPPPIPPHCSTESKGPRLIIKKIENNNFKSYAGKVTLGPFHHCFTAIIGPNGSGKSNVIDSLLFVFGYRANKIRCKKLSTLLHNSARYPNCISCSVGVHFRQIEDQPDGSCIEIANSDIIVERTAFRDNSSYYTINGKRVHFKEVSKLLKQHHIDLDHNRFLILQGEVESIAMMKPKAQTENDCGMLEYLEDIIGTSRYKQPLVLINERVQQLTEERTSRHIRCKLAEREIDDLEKPYTEAIEFLRLENENTRTKNLRIQKYLSEKNKKVEQYTKEHEETKSELEKHDAESEAIKQKRIEKQNLAKEEMRQFEELKKKKDVLQKDFENATSKFTETQSTMAVINKRRKENKVQLEKLEEEIIGLRKVPQKNQEEIQECTKKKEHLNEDKVKLEKVLQENYTLVESQTKPLIEKREKLEIELVDLKRNVDEAKSAVTLAESELSLLKRDEVTEQRKYETFKSSLEETKKDIHTKQERYNEVKKTLPQFHEEIQTRTAEIQRLQKDEGNIRQKLMRLKDEINERQASIQNSNFNNKIVNFLMRQKNEGKIPGILGRLGDLGAIDAKYDVAISTCCGRLDNILVDTVNTAQACIEQLKRYDIGRASFVALDKISHYSKYMAPIQTPENVPRLFDLIRVEDERLRAAFYFSLHDTLVANDLDQATRIAYGKKRYRVVTLKGDIIELAGTMSGGGRSQMRGKMGTKVQVSTKETANDSLRTEKALDEMQAQAQTLQSQVNHSQEKQGELESEINGMKNKQRQFDNELQTLGNNLKYLEDQLPRLAKQLEQQKQRAQQTKTDAGKVEKMEKEIAEKNDKLKKSEDAADVLDKKIKEFRDEIDKIHGEKVKSVQTKINNLNTQIKKLTNNVSKLSVEITTSERNVTKTEQKIENLKSEILKAQDELTSLNDQRQKYDEETKKLDIEIENAQKDIENAKQGSSGIHKEILALEKEESDKKLERVEKEQRLQTITTKLNDVKAQIPHWREQLKPLKLHEIPGQNEADAAPLKSYTEEELAAHTLQDIQYKESVQEELLKKKPNLSVIKEYTVKRNAFYEQAKELEDITMKRNEMRQVYDDTRKKRFNEFTQGFNIITRKLKEMYQMITQGGDAELELVDSMDPFTEGVSFSVRPPKKTWKNISNLSGGEKTLSSLALVFALHYYKPSPLYFMDEIDAALDFKNISIVASYIKDRTKNAQFIIISLRSNMFELSDYIVGIYKVRDCTDSVTIKNKPPKYVATTQTQELQVSNSSIDSNTFDELKNSGTNTEKEQLATNDDHDNEQNPAADETVTESLVDKTLTENSIMNDENESSIENITQNSISPEEPFKRPLPPPPLKPNSTVTETSPNTTCISDDSTTTNIE